MDNKKAMERAELHRAIITSNAGKCGGKYYNSTGSLRASHAPHRHWENAGEQGRCWGVKDDGLRTVHRKNI